MGHVHIASNCVSKVDQSNTNMTHQPVLTPILLSFKGATRHRKKATIINLKHNISCFSSHPNNTKIQHIIKEKNHDL